MTFDECRTAAIEAARKMDAEEAHARAVEAGAAARAAQSARCKLVNARPWTLDDPHTYRLSLTQIVENCVPPGWERGPLIIRGKAAAIRRAKISAMRIRQITALDRASVEVFDRRGHLIGHALSTAFSTKFYREDDRNG